MNFKNIMIIDDAEIDLYITAHMIVNSSIETNIIQYAMAKEALEYLELNQDNREALPEIILLDIYMPIMSGFEFLRAYDKLPLSLKQHCKVIIITSNSNDDDITLINSDQNVVVVQEKPISKYFLDNIPKLIRDKGNAMLTI